MSIRVRSFCLMTVHEELKFLLDRVYIFRAQYLSFTFKKYFVILLYFVSFELGEHMLHLVNHYVHAKKPYRYMLHHWRSENILA